MKVLKNFSLLLIVVFFLAGCNQIPSPPDEGVNGAIKNEINLFLDQLEQALKSDEVDQLFPFYDLPFTAIDYESGYYMNITTEEELRGYLENNILLGEPLESEFQNRKITVNDEENAVVETEEYWVIVFEGDTFSATDQLRLTLKKVGGTWKISMLELFGRF